MTWRHKEPKQQKPWYWPCLPGIFRCQEVNSMMTSSNGNIFRVTGLLCGEFTGYRWVPHTQRPVTRSFDVYFDLRLNKRLSKQWWCWWFKTPPRPLWRHRNVCINHEWFDAHGDGSAGWIIWPLWIKTKKYVMMFFFNLCSIPCYWMSILSEKNTSFQYR